ncbi:MAG: restriction endonuclease subunit S [Muribaculaceae bacterium]|nr:restriction endonuclease subunit S [Muribaculaceae bacterium]
MTEWRSYKLSDIADLSNGINFDKSAYTSGVKLIGVADFKDRIYPDYETLQEVDSKVVREGDFLEKGDIVFVRSNGNKELVGRCLMINKDIPVTFSGFCIRLRLRDKHAFNPVFFNYLFKTQQFRKNMTGTAVGANIQNLSQSRLGNCVVEVPDGSVQRRIAEVLSRYDALIENYQRQIKLLEEAAQRLYKEWFVDLRFPGHQSTPIINNIPQSWQKKKIADVCDTIGGGTPSTKNASYYEGGDIKWVTPTDITQSKSLCILDTEKKITEEGLNNSSAKMLPPGTILMTSRASVGFFGICDFEVCTNQGFISCVPFKKEFQMYLLFNLRNRVDEIRGKAGGSTYLEISKRVFRELDIICPDTRVLLDFQERAHSILEMIRNNTVQIRNLSEARDRLLPKLMSAQIEV